MNLQLCAPYKKCPFKCPMCIASKAPRFTNLYGKDKDEYFKSLDLVLMSNDIKTIVITGDTEPTIQRLWMCNTIEWLKKNYSEITIELQTHVYNNPYLYCEEIDKVCYSITTMLDLINFEARIKQGIIPNNSRVVILATEELISAISSKKNLISFNSDQVTIKILQETAYLDEDKDLYIKNEAVSPKDRRIKSLIRKFKHLKKSVVLDVNCQEAEGRYKIFREDGFVYPTWDSLKPELC